MKQESLRRTGVGQFAALLLATLMATTTAAQEPVKTAGAQSADKPAAKATASRKKPRGRLPTYFGKVVNAKQRDEIYSIQSKYSEQISKLKEQLDSLVVKRDSEVEQVLTDEQRAEVAKMKAERKSRRGKASSKASSGD